MQINQSKNLIDTAYQQIRDFQDGLRKPILTGKEFIDNVGIGLHIKNVLVLAANSGVGKSHMLQSVMKNIMNPSINSDAMDYVYLNISLEMSMFSLLLRSLSDTTNKSKVDILNHKFTAEELDLVKKLTDDLKDNRYYISQTPTTPLEFYTHSKKFLDDNRDKKAVFISIDHIILLQGSNKQKVIEETIEYVNNLKMEYANVIFVLVSQTNGDNAKRAEEANKRSEPILTDLYYSAFIGQIADYVIVLQNPYKLGIQEYSKINPKRYPHLTKYFLEEKKNKVSLLTTGVIYIHVIKCREAESHFVDIYAEDLFVPEEMINEKFETVKPVFTMAKFENTSFETEVEDYLSKDDNDAPF